MLLEMQFLLQPSRVCSGTSVDRQCGSSQQAVHFAIQAVMSGTQDVVIGGGVEVMSMVPIGAEYQEMGMKLAMAYHLIQIA